MPTILDTLSIQTCVCSYGKEASFAGSLANVAITVTPKALGVNQLRLVWAATGDIFSSFTDSTVGGSGTPGIIVLPQTGQDGFRHGTSTFKDWYYEAAVTATTADGQQLSRTYRFQIPAGTTTLDLDMLDEDGIVTAMPAIAPIPTVTSVNGQTGAVTITGGSGGAAIDDTTTSTSNVWSASKVSTSLAGKATPADITTAITNLVGGASAALDTLSEIDAQMTADEGSAAALAALVATKADAASVAATYVPILTPASTYTWNADGTIATETIGGVTTTFTWNSDGTLATETRAGVTRTYTYSNGTLASVA